MKATVDAIEKQKQKQPVVHLKEERKYYKFIDNVEDLFP